MAEIKKKILREKAVFAMGCFWGVQALFDSVPGVLKTSVGYTGGDMENPKYQQVCTNSTGHAEAVEIEFDSSKISYEKLLEVFWNNHDPTTPDRQGPDIGSQYRSAIFYFNEGQKKKAEESKIKMKKKIEGRRIVTEIAEAGKFWTAEEYHQKYYAKKGIEGGCRIK